MAEKEKKAYRKEWEQEKGLPYKMTEMRGGSVFSADLSKKPISKKYRKMIKTSKRLIKVGSVEALEHGDLKCYVKDGFVIVGLYSKGKSAQELYYKPKKKSEIEEGARIPEERFAMEDHFFVGTPWHEKDGIALWTVSGLRKNGKPEKQWYKD